MDWTQGYVADTQYTAGFYRETTPPFFTLAGLMTGTRVPDFSGPFQYCELGCGQGVGTVVMAAAAPQGRFVGIDFNPGQIENARRLAAAGGLDNVRFVEAGFADLLEPGHDWPEFDYIALHGVYSWISPENRAAIGRFIGRTLKPGGLVYVSYNCMPGWSAMAPAQRLMREVASRKTGRSDARAQAGLELLELLNGAGSRFFPANPAVAPRVTKAKTLDKTYLAHEYLNANWHPLYVTDVIAEMAQAKLSYLGSATLVENLDTIFLPQAVRDAAQVHGDSAFTELLKDFHSNKQFRRDIYVRGPNRFTAFESLARMRGLTFALAAPPDAIKLSFDTIMGEAKGNEAIYAAIVDALRGGAAKFTEITAACTGKVAEGDVFQALYLLVYSNQVVMLDSAEPEAIARGQAFNRALLAELRQGRVLPFMAIPGSGTGFPVGLNHLFILCALDEGLQDADAITPRLIALLNANNVRLLKDGAALTEPAEVDAEATRQVEDALARHLPIWRSLGILINI